MCRETTTIDSISLHLNEHGIKINNSLLWLDSFYDGPFSFISSAEGFKAPGPNTQLILSEETHSLVKSKYNLNKTLLCQFNRPFSLGELTLELLPAGTIPGAANLLISVNQQKIFYGAAFQTDKNPHTRSLQIRSAQTLILNVKNPQKTQQPYLRKSEHKKLLNMLLQPKYKNSLLVCDTWSVAEVLSLLLQHDLKAVVHPSLQKILRKYKDCGINLGKYSVFNDKVCNNPEGVLLVPKKNRGRKHQLQLMNRPQIIIEDTLEQFPCAFFEDKIFLPRSVQHSELIKITKEIAPSKIYTVGPYAHLLTDKIKVPTTSLFPNNTLPLF
jgi:putative mRNA 3-end processing factor